MDYVKTKPIHINLNEIIHSCNAMNNIVMHHFKNSQKSFAGKSSIPTQLFNSYNLLMYPLPQFHELYSEIKQFFYDELSPNPDTKYYIQSWLNYYHKGDYIEWHSHWKPELNTWHGFFCVNTEPSYTSYKIPNYPDIVDIECKNNLLVMSPSNGDEHRSSEWAGDNPRITIAFDIVPREHIGVSINHWIPI
jgi:hypothetical protein